MEWTYGYLSEPDRPFFRYPPPIDLPSPGTLTKTTAGHHPRRPGDTFSTHKPSKPLVLLENRLISSYIARKPAALIAQQNGSQRRRFPFWPSGSLAALLAGIGPASSLAPFLSLSSPHSSRFLLFSLLYSQMLRLSPNPFQNRKIYSLVELLAVSEGLACRQGKSQGPETEKLSRPVAPPFPYPGNLFSLSSPRRGEREKSSRRGRWAKEGGLGGTIGKRGKKKARAGGSVPLPWLLFCSVYSRSRSASRIQALTLRP